MAKACGTVEGRETDSPEMALRCWGDWATGLPGPPRVEHQAGSSDTVFKYDPELSASEGVLLECRPPHCHSAVVSLWLGWLWLWRVNRRLCDQARHRGCSGRLPGVDVIWMVKAIAETTVTEAKLDRPLLSPPPPPPPPHRSPSP